MHYKNEISLKGGACRAEKKFKIHIGSKGNIVLKTRLPCLFAFAF